MSPTLSPLEQKAMWDGWLSADIRANYFADLCHRYQIKQRWVTWLTLTFSSGALLTLLWAWLPSEIAWVRAALAALAAFCSLWLVVSQNQKNATDCSDLHARWRTLANEFESLWASGMYERDAIAKLDALRKRDVEIGKSSNSFPNDRKRMKYWQEHVQRHHATA